jgi:hypothetical protein
MSLAEPHGQATDSQTQKADPVSVSTEQTQSTTTSVPDIEGEPEGPLEGQAAQSLDSDVDLDQFELTPHTSVPDSTPSTPLVDP